MSAAPEQTGHAARALWAFLAHRHLRDGMLVGPDSGVRFNYRVGRFVKSYTRALPWRDSLTYMQAQGYWILANWRLSAPPHADRPAAMALECSRGVLSRQRPDGAWDYPNPEWRGRVATVEGTWASLGLLESFRRSGDHSFLHGALAWHRFLEDRIGWTPAAGGAAVNYFAGRSDSAVPNNTVLVLRLLAELARATDDDRFLSRADAALAFLARVQQPNGETPYNVDPAGGLHTLHFQCLQYAAFQALDLADFADLTGDPRAEEVLSRLIAFLRDRIGAGPVPYACDRRHPSVTYQLAAIAAALDTGAARGLDGCDRIARRILAEVLGRATDDGSFPHSLHDYGVLSDRRGYPRYLAMILLHLLPHGRAGGQHVPAAAAAGTDGTGTH
jgi:hypothetical protein